MIIHRLIQWSIKSVVIGTVAFIERWHVFCNAFTVLSVTLPCFTVKDLTVFCHRFDPLSPYFSVLLSFVWLYSCLQRFVWDLPCLISGFTVSFVVFLVFNGVLVVVCHVCSVVSQWFWLWWTRPGGSGVEVGVTVLLDLWGQRSEEEARLRPGLRRSGGLTRRLPRDWPPSPKALRLRMRMMLVKGRFSSRLCLHTAFTPVLTSHPLQWD